MLSNAGPWNNSEFSDNSGENNNQNNNVNVVEEFPLEKLPTNEGFQEDFDGEERLDGEDITSNVFGREN